MNTFIDIIKSIRDIKPDEAEKLIEESGNDKSENVQKMEIVYITVIVILLIIIGVLSFLVAKNYYHNKRNNKKKAYFMEDSTDMPIDDGKE